VLKATPLIVNRARLAVCYRLQRLEHRCRRPVPAGVLSAAASRLWLTTSGIVLPKIVAVPLVLACSVLGGNGLGAGLTAACCATSSMQARSWSA